MASRISAPDIYSFKGTGRKIVSITAYDSVSAQLAEEADVDFVLVGDSVANTIYGLATTHGVDLGLIARHTQAVANHISKALLVADMPFGSYQSSVAQAVDSAVELLRAGAQAVKLEGAYVDEIRAIHRAGIPVMGHVGMTPQSVNAFGGFRVQGRSNPDFVLNEAKAIDDAGVFAMVIELVPAELAQKITETVGCPTIGIGAGGHCDGQIQVFHDVVGLSAQVFRHAKRFANGRQVLLDALRSYTEETRSGIFPSEENSF